MDFILDFIKVNLKIVNQRNMYIYKLIRVCFKIQFWAVPKSLNDSGCNLKVSKVCNFETASIRYIENYKHEIFDSVYS